MVDGGRCLGTGPGRAQVDLHTPAVGVTQGPCLDGQVLAPPKGCSLHADAVKVESHGCVGRRLARSERSRYFSFRDARRIVLDHETPDSVIKGNPDVTGVLLAVRPL